MNKKGKNIELKIYELLGVKIFRKMAFGLRDKIWILYTLKMSKEERKDYLYHTASNYNLGKVNSLEDIKKFKKELFTNAAIHIWALSLCIPTSLKVIAGTASLLTTIFNLFLIGLNLYCVMLQRYNGIRINQLIEKMTPRYEKQKDVIREELKKEDSLLGEHTYKIVEKKGKEIGITFDELIANATIEELKQYRNHLKYFKLVNQNIQENDNYLDNQPANVRVHLKKHKSLKLELKPNKYNKSAN